MKIERNNTASGIWEYIIDGEKYILLSADPSTQNCQRDRHWMWMKGTLQNPQNNITGGGHGCRTRKLAEKNLIETIQGRN